MSTSTEEPDSREVQGDDEFRILEADEKAEEAESEGKGRQEVEVPVEPTDEIVDNTVPIIGIASSASCDVQALLNRFVCRSLHEGALWCWKGVRGRLGGRAAVHLHP